MDLEARVDSTVIDFWTEYGASLKRDLRIEKKQHRIIFEDWFFAKSEWAKETDIKTTFEIKDTKS